MKFPDAPQPPLRWAEFVYTYGTGLWQTFASLRNLIADAAPASTLDPTPAVRYFGIQQPVEVYRVPLGHYALNGSFGSIRLERPTFRTWIASEVEDEIASAVLWHELTHAAQFEAIPNFMSLYHDAYQRYVTNGNRWQDYCAIPYEAEAYEAMNNHFQMPLICDRMAA